MNQLAGRLGVSTAVAGAIVALAIVQLAFQIFALADLARRNAVRGGHKWVWAIVIVLGNVIGAIAYLVAGRTPPGVDVPGGASATGGDAARRAVDTLYGPHNDR